MKRVAAIALTVMLVALPVLAATAEQEAKPAAKSGNVNGVVSAVTNTSLTVKTSSGEETFSIVEKTKVIGSKMGRQAEAMKKAGEKTVITEFVQTGDAVSVRFTDDGGTKKASEVRVTKKTTT
jgi:hypothetical protein